MPEKKNIQNILVTGASGNLGQAILRSGLFAKTLAPSSTIFNLSDSHSMRTYLSRNPIDAVIHCAAMARMSECSKDPVRAIETNTIGTASLVKEILAYEKKKQKSVRFIHLSTDAVYPCVEGNYREDDRTIPYNEYGWTKLGAECAVRLLENYCIVRTRFFDPERIRFDTAATDLFTSTMPIGELVSALSILVRHDFTGPLNIGGPERSDYDAYRRYKSSIKPCRRKDIQKEINFNLAHNASMNCSKWKAIKKKVNAGTR